MRYGMPYKGSKNAIAEKIISALPPAEHFYDLFGGGGAITHCAVLSGKYKHVHYNELDPLIFKGFKMAVNGEFKDENRWISREDFIKLKDTDPYVAICFSFGNDLKTYCYSPKKEPFKKAVHDFLFFNDKTGISKFISVDGCHFSSNNIHIKRLEFQRWIKLYKEKLKSYYNTDKMNVITHANCLDRLVSFGCEGVSGLSKVNTLSINNKSYAEIEIKNNSIIYCDPPYKSTNTYRECFDHNTFYKWAKEQDNIFISEYAMPDDFVELVSINKRVLMDATRKGENKQEKIFTNRKTYERMIANNLLLW